MAKNLDVVLLLDLYGDMLTVKQKDFLGYYYNDDLSLSEIAENEGITRQGVRDAIKRAEALLYEMENRLGLSAKLAAINEKLNAVMNAADNIESYNDKHSNSPEILDNVIKIKAAVMSIV